MDGPTSNINIDIENNDLTVQQPQEPIDSSFPNNGQKKNIFSNENIDWNSLNILLLAGDGDSDNVNINDLVLNENSLQYIKTSSSLVQQPEEEEKEKLEIQGMEFT